MLEAIRERAQGWLAKLILALITIPFALWGIDSYIHSGGESPLVARVGDDKITLQEFSQTLKDQQERMRSALGRNFDPAMMDRPEIKRSVLDGLISRHLLAIAAKDEGLAVSDAQLAKIIAGVEGFWQDGKFSQARYEFVLRQQNMTPAAFESRLRQDVLTQMVADGLSGTAFLPRTTIDNLIRLGEQQREVSVATIGVDQFLPQVKIDPAAARTFYNQHQSDFRVAEQVRVEYAVLSADALAPKMNVAEDEIKKYYDEHAAQYQQPEERQASHILIAVPPGASAADKAAAQEKALQILKQVKQSPANFAQLAKQHSQDPGSAGQGGDLGYFARGAMAKPFEDAVFKIAVGEVSDLVQTEFGFHIIKLTAIKPAKTTRALAEVKDEISTELRKQKAAKKFVESAETFSNLVYEQADSLKPAAEALGLTLQTSSWISRSGGEVPLLNNDRLLQAVFSEEAVKNKRNTEAVEVAPNTLVAARVLEFKPASVRPFEEVAAAITQRLQREQASALAIKQGREALAQLQQGKEVTNLAWGGVLAVTRQNPQGLTEAALKQVFRADAGKLPAYAGLESPQGGFTLLKVVRVIEAGDVEASKKQAYAARLQSILGQEYAAAQLAGLKQRTKIEIKREALEKSER
ncbi:MAG: SurA N-terminal domain-containing protein [Pseudomonadota bacterium]